MIREVRRYEIPVDDQVHTLELTNPPLAVAAKSTGFAAYAVELWSEFNAERALRPVRFTVIGTGHPVPVRAEWVGTCDRLDGLVWHLYEVPAQ